ncbi:uncharacterized protein B0I36DRAFT_347635 [Microdochium trichocladiopsis]|uniref:Zn(2)-C6 fungal-type domain-containing protein n=1 Tax=Microdochium trichocladiopsis TaxID=1682393 RepID=A0A9P9BTT6_9PEZI|nr:uncharacterized protein B0I36DRAFT_347635 [Microdochium trichocladiopsis]KAH7035924.1 hypothetical protein B0I36DRAFT_347635 [Microdochium trichocladiopsis]
MGATPPSDPGPEGGRRELEAGPPPQAVRVKRAQVPRACPRCRKLQKACSDFRPCQRCVRAGLAKQCGSGLALEPQLPRQARAPAGFNAAADGSGGGNGGIPSPGTASTSGGAAAAPSPLSVSLTNSAASPVTPHAYTSFARDSFHRQTGLLSPPVIQHCSDRFHERLYPTIPIATQDYLRRLAARTDGTEAGNEAYCVLLGMSAMVLLQVEDPLGTGIAPAHIPAKNNRAYGSILLEEALAAHRHLARRPNPSFEHVLLTFFIYACHGTLLHHSQAFFFLREATTLHHLTRLETMDPPTRQLAERLFWVLLISERSHGIRYRRPVTLQVTSAGPILPMYPASQQPLHAGFVCLAALFRPLDTSFIALLNQELTSIRPSIESLDEVEAGVASALDERSLAVLEATQKANLFITQAWLLIIIWQLRLRLGQLIAPNATMHDTGTANTLGARPSMSRTYGYPLHIARSLTLSVQDLPLDSIKVHGVGITEKVFDVACAVANVLARIPFFEDFSAPDRGLMSGSARIHDDGSSSNHHPHHHHETAQMTRKAMAENDFTYLRRLMQQLPSGLTVYDDLLVKHINQDADGAVT